MEERHVTSAMNEWGFIDQDILVGIGKSATNCKFKYVWLVPVER